MSCHTDRRVRIAAAKQELAPEPLARTNREMWLAYRLFSILWVLPHAMCSVRADQHPTPKLWPGDTSDSSAAAPMRSCFRSEDAREKTGCLDPSSMHESLISKPTSMIVKVMPSISVSSSKSSTIAPVTGPGGSGRGWERRLRHSIRLHHPGCVLSRATPPRPERWQRQNPLLYSPPDSKTQFILDPGTQRPHAPPPPITNAPNAILDAWTALEVLSPPAFRRPENLSGGDRTAIAWLDRARLPWEGAGEKARRNTRLFYQVVLGTVDLDAAVTGLLSRYTDTRADRPSARGEAILAVAILDRSGRPVEAPAAVLSSFGWGLRHARRGDLRRLADWRTAERTLVEQLDEELRRAGEDGEPRPLDRAALTAAFHWLVDTVGLPRELVKPPRFAVRSYEYYKSTEPPEPLLLNSFFLNDLAAARTLIHENRATSNLRRYLGVEIPSAPQDLLHNRNALEDAVAPAKIPPARWPGRGRHPLVLLQQAAVNLALHELQDTGILAVNGPPGHRQDDAPTRPCSRARYGACRSDGSLR